jgi:hypothetical protein
MNPILVQQMARHQMDTFDREAKANRHAVLVERAAVSPFARRARLNETAARLRIVLRGSAA